LAIRDVTLFVDAEFEFFDVVFLLGMEIILSQKRFQDRTQAEHDTLSRDQ